MSRLDGGAKKSVQGLSSSVMGLAKTLGLAALAYKAFQFAGESLKATREFESLENAIVFASGSAEAGAKTMDYLRERSELLGTDLVASAEGFKTLSGALMGTKLEGQGTRDVFDAIQVASSVMGLSADDAKGAMLALGQMVGKGTVQAEELRGQLGERIPGAFKIAARSMNVTEQELGKMMEQGQVVAEDFLPGFANELKKTFGPGLENSVESSQSQLNRFNNTMLELKLGLGSALMPIIDKLMTGFKNIFGFFKTNAAVITQALAPLITHFKILWDMTAGFFNQLSGGATITETLQTAFTYLQEGLKFLTPVFEALRGVVQAVFDAIIKIKNGISSFLDRFPIIGKTLRGFAFMIREAFISILNSAKSILGGVGDLLAGIFSGNVDQIKAGLKGLNNAFKPVKTAQNLAGAFSDGFNSEMIKDPLQLKVEGQKERSKNFTDVLKDQKVGGVGGAAAAAAGKGKKSSTSVDGVKSGRPTSVHININKLIETFNVSATNITDINNKAKDLVAQALLSAVNNVNNIAQ
jgi:tape measure domain-containing protein